MDNEWGKFLHDESFLVGLSIDGPQKIHDRFRKDNHGQGSLASVMRDLEILNQHQVEFNILTVLHNHNGEQPKNIQKFLKGSGTNHMQFIPIVERDPSGSVTPESVRPKQWGRFLKEVFSQWSESDIGEIFIQLFEIYLGLNMGIQSPLSVHAETCGRAAAFEHNGDLFACDHYVFKDHCLDSIKAKAISEMIDGPFQLKFGVYNRDGPTTYCKNCSYSKLCNGGCTSYCFFKAPDGKSGHKYLCEGFRIFFQHSLPYFRAMAACLHSRLPAKEYKFFLDSRTKQTSIKISRNTSCPCGSEEKYKTCCGY